MKSLGNASIRTKLILLAGVAVFCALLVSSTGIVLKDVEMIRRAMIEQLEVQARMMEFNSDGVLAFADAAAAEELLQAMAQQPAVEMACLLDLDDVVLASYRKDEEAPFRRPDRLVEGARATDDGFIEIVTPVCQDDEAQERVGTLYIRANTHNIAAHTAAQLRFIAMASLASLLVAITVAAFLQKKISDPILRLTEAAQVITREEDYSIRVSWPAQDELGTLYESFNRMLDALKSTHDQVANQAEQLGKEVAVRKRTEEELLVAKEAAEASNRTKSEFLANMSHEIRTPLTGILGFTDVLLAGGDDGDQAKRHEYLATIQASGKHLLGLINDILDLSKIESGRMEFESEACQPDRLVAEVVRVLQVKAAEKSLDLTVHWDTQIPQMVFTDAARVRQALINIIGNAIKFTAQGGVSLMGRLVTCDKGPQLQIDVTDTGIGIASDKIDHIFDPFIQADNSVTRRFGGTGLGLAISRRIARGLGGDLTAASEPGKGSVFTLRFSAGDIAGVPLITPAVIQKAPAGATTSTQAQTVLPPVNILLVEDGETNRKLIKLMLERAGAKVTTAENGEIGCRVAMDKPFAVILMDMQMPVLDGYSATRRLRDAGATLPIIALTANAMTADRQKCLEVGCTDYLTKPINTEQLFAVLANVLSPPEAPAGDQAGVESRPTENKIETKLAPVAASPRDIASSLPIDDRQIAEIVVEYIETLEGKLKEMEAAWDSGNLDDLAALAHWLKGSGGTAGFGVFNQPAASLERIAKRLDAGDVPAMLAELRTLHQRLVVPELK
jgi:signal transduction histidine kinase/DNA-binding NarL/FixJ family response regulator/HPt (histidine-containing phosphotransfer) domain-containing protein